MIKGEKQKNKKLRYQFFLNLNLAVILLKFIKIDF